MYDLGFLPKGSLLKKLLWFKAVALSAASAIIKTVTGTAPITLTNAISHAIISLTQTGKCVQDGTPTPDAPVDILCNNGALRMVDDELPAAYKRVLGFSMENNAYWEIPNFPLNGSDTLRFSFEATDACNVIGSYSGSASGNNYSLYVVSLTGNYLRYKNGAYNSIVDLNTRYDVEITPTGSSGMKVDSTWAEQTFTTPTNFCIGTTSLTASSSKFRGNLYGNIEVVGRAKLIPCERVSDNVLGYYDTVGGSFYEQASGFDGAVSLGYDGSHYTLGVVGTPEVLTVGGQNLVDLTAVTDGYYYDPNGVLTEAPVARLTDYIPVRAGQKYTLYVKAAQSGVSANVRCNLFNSVQEWMAQSAFTVNSGSEAVSTITPTENGHLRVSANATGTGAKVDWSTFQIVRGEYTLATMPPYEPYVQPQTVNDVRMLLGLGDTYRDAEELISGLLTHKVGVYVITGAEGWSKYNNVFFCNDVISPADLNTACVCTHYVGVKGSTALSSMSDGQIKTGTSSSTRRFFIQDDSCSTEADLTEKLAAMFAAGTPPILVYPLATATTEQTTPHSLHTNAGTNVVDVVSNVDPVELTVEYKGTADGSRSVPMLGASAPTEPSEDEPKDEPKEEEPAEPTDPTEEVGESR